MNLRHILWRLREEFHPEKHPFDIENGFDTSGMIYWRRLGAEATDYQPVDPDVFRAAMARVIEQIGRHGDESVADFTFVDLGCGKGRALLLAEAYDFKQIVGVDFSARLIRVASRNAAKAGSTRIRVVRRDVREFDFPAGPLVVFLYNPFSAPVTRSVMRRLSSHPDPFCIAYVNPLHADAVSSLSGGHIVAKDDWCMVWRFPGRSSATHTQASTIPSNSSVVR